MKYARPVIAGLPLKQLEFPEPGCSLVRVFLPDGNGVDLVSSVKKNSP